MDEFPFEGQPNITEVIALLENEQRKTTRQYDPNEQIYKFPLASKWSNTEKAQRFVNNTLEILLAFGLGKFNAQMDETLQQLLEESLSVIITDKLEMLFDDELNPDTLVFDFFKNSNFANGNLAQFLQFLHSISQPIPRRYTSPALAKLKKCFYNLFEKEKALQRISDSQKTFNELYKALS